MTVHAPWGLDADHHPKTVHEAVEERIEAAFRKYIETAIATGRAGGLDEKTLHQMRWLHLAEPWLPATAATRMLEEAMLLVSDPTV